MNRDQPNKYTLEQIHPALPEAYDQWLQNRISRREFIRFASLLGLSTATASLIACGQSSQPQATATPTGIPNQIKRGGTFTSASRLQLLDHPARVSWIAGANIIRQLGEYLTETGPDNITRPYLLDRWQTSEDLKTWTLHLKKNITFNHGDPLTAEDILFTFGQWLDESVGSSMFGLLSYIGGMQNIEKIDNHTVKLHLAQPNIGVPEHLFHYPGIVLHHGFEGDIVKQPVGTGAFLLKEYAEGERAVFTRRPDYWRPGADGQPLPYLDELIYVSVDKNTAVAAIQSGQVDSFSQPRPSDWLALKDFSGVAVQSVSTAQCFLLRMRVDLKPWNDVRVRNALKKCQDRKKILQLSYDGQGDLSLDAHVAPVHPAYCPQQIPSYDPQGAKALLAAAGYPNGLKVTLSTKNDQSEPEIAQALKELAAPGGFDIGLDITEPAGYWDRWRDVGLGISAWSHRSLDTMVLPLAYSGNAAGEPVAWNETRWVDDEFIALLRQAEATLDVKARRQLMCQLQTIMQQRGGIGNSYWLKIWNITRTEFKNIKAHPAAYDMLYEVWKDA